MPNFFLSKSLLYSFGLKLLVCPEEKCLHVYYTYYTTDIIYLCIILQTSIPSTIYFSISGYNQSTLGFILKLTPIDYEQTSFCIRSPQLTVSLAVQGS